MSDHEQASSSAGRGATPSELTQSQRYVVLITAFLGWMFAGTQMAITGIVMRPAARDLLSGATSEEGVVGFWISLYVCAFLFGAAAGGLVFGWFGDRFGRSKAMAASILCYSLFAASAYLAEDTWQLLIVRFLACMGVGGMWPNGISLVSEAWSNLSRPMIAGVIGTAANVGIMGASFIASQEQYAVTSDTWRMAMLISASPVFLGLFSLFCVPESPRWLATRLHISTMEKAPTPVAEVFRPPFLGLALVGIALATVPLLGGWGAAQWMTQWADQVGTSMTPPDETLKAKVSLYRSVTGTVGSFLGGVIASFVGRRMTYFLISIVALGSAQYTFWFLHPTEGSFMIWVSVLGFFSGIYFGWLPLCLPEMFPTRVRSTGAGVSFNFGRILTAVTVFISGWLLHSVFSGEYQSIGQVTSLIYLIGAIAICYAPDTSKKGIED